MSLDYNSLNNTHKVTFFLTMYRIIADLCTKSFLILMPGDFSNVRAELQTFSEKSRECRNDD